MSLSSGCSIIGVICMIVVCKGHIVFLDSFPCMDFIHIPKDLWKVCPYLEHASIAPGDEFATSWRREMGQWPF